jgi:hypothetical protein
MGRQGRQRRRNLGALALLLACTSLAACGGDEEAASTSSTTPSTSTASSGGLSVEVRPASASPGDQVEARVVNDTDEQFTYGAAYEMEVNSGGTWKPVELPVEPVPEIGYVAPPGETGPPVAVDLPEDLAPGTYRVVIRRNVPGVGDLSGELEVVDKY